MKYNITIVIMIHEMKSVIFLSIHIFSPFLYCSSIPEHCVMTTMTMTPSLEPLPWCTLNRPLWIRNPVSQSMTRSVFFLQSCLPPLSESFHTRAKCKIRIMILVTDHANDDIFGPRVRKLESRSLNSTAQSQMMVRMNAVTSKFWFGRWCYVTF